ncbi:hypothetical protein IVB30_20205 [Bradyrhizobium sp. 200]|uniref:hypothetical protein n=1 Tax=Bradyrhizobium sp. 200 TaxID=2782665 RepID=UPI001FFF9C14|nr:hypothetical protein [Bradyrhizobium sp. 200]UPJ53431.1 hypothetical protein IVB30_20205 [Bradyrhizobium sp. 200]
MSIDPRDRRPDEGGALGEPLGLVGIPGYATGGVVDRTGIALVHQGEYILPAPGSEAIITPSGEAAGAGPVINYFFPIEIEVVGVLDERQLKQVASHVFAELHSEFDSCGL